MITLELAVEVAQDFDRIFDHFAQYNPSASLERIQEIVDGLDILTRHPLMGRPLSGKNFASSLAVSPDGELRELVLGAKNRGYLALYNYSADLEIVFILAVRSQREAGYVREDSA